MSFITGFDAAKILAGLVGGYFSSVNIIRVVPVFVVLHLKETSRNTKKMENVRIALI